jgi:imidazolonepropionase-like amidohydrolase
MKLTTACALLMLAAPAAAQQVRPVTYIQAGALLDRPGQPPRGASTVVIEGDRITAVRDGFVAPPAGATLVDLRNRFVLPGLIDAHVHLLGIGGDPQRERLTALNRDDADDMVEALANMKVTLAAGFTTVRDLGGDPRGVRALRDGEARGVVAGPAIVNAGQMISVTGGHGDGTNGLAEEWAEAVHAHAVNICDGPDDCRRAVRHQVALGAQVIKFAATGGVLSNVSGGLGRAMTPEEMRAIVETAHALGRKVAAHSHAADGTRAALEAGVDSVEHASYLDADTIRLFKAKGAYLVPTEIAPLAAVAQARAGVLPPAVLPKAEAAVKALHASHKQAWAAGVKFAFGTDTGVSKHGDNATEFRQLVDLGMTPAQAIRSATVAAADLLGEAEVGTIEPGKRADLIAVTGSPLDDVTRLEHVGFVMHRGVVAKSE